MRECGQAFDRNDLQVSRKLCSDSLVFIPDVTAILL